MTFRQSACVSGFVKVLSIHKSAESKFLNFNLAQIDFSLPATNKIRLEIFWRARNHFKKSPRLSHISLVESFMRNVVHIFAFSAIDFLPKQNPINYESKFLHYAGINFIHSHPLGHDLKGANNHSVQKPSPRDNIGSQKPHPRDIKLENFTMYL